MSSYFASITSSAAISNLSTRFTSLRRAISSDETDDPDSEDSSHISNVLRAYYAEKGRVLPPWLPADPKAPAAATPAIATVQRQQVYGEAASVPTPGGGGRGGLSDLWGDDSSQQPPAQQTMSLRRPRGVPQQVAQQQGQPLLHVSSAPPSRPSTSTGSSRNPAGYVDRPEASLTPPPSSGARPLPSQRAGSYQASQAAAQQQSRLPLDRASSSGSAQDRLRARLHGGSSSSGGGGSSGSAPPTLPPGSSGGGGGGGQPYVAAGRPWESGDSGFGGGYGSSSAYGSNTGRSPGPTGLPSGPRPPRPGR